MTTRSNNYKNCCGNSCPDKDKPDLDKTKKLREEGKTDDSTNGATFFHDKSIDTPDWIKKQIAAGKMQEVRVPGCDKFRFYKVL